MIRPRHVVRFRDLKIGDHFKFANDVADRYASGWHNTAKKITSRCYVWTAKHGVVSRRGGYRTRAGVLKSCVGSVNVGVEWTGRSSPVKRRRGRGRGKSVLGGYSKSNRRTRRYSKRRG